MTLVKVNVNFQAMTESIRKAIERGVDMATVEMGREMEKMLSQPGTGRVYLIKGGSGEYSKKAIAALRRSRVFATAGYNDRFRFITRANLSQILRDMRARGLKNPKTIRAVGFHKASAPGRPPARNTGNLARSWQTGVAKRGKVEKAGNRYRLVVGSILPYAKYLEFGTRRMKARPYVRPVAEIMRRRTPLIINLAVSNAIAKTNGGKR